MLRWLNGGKGDPKEREIPLYADAELQVTQSGQVQDLPGSLKLHDLIRASYEARRQARSPAALKEELRRLGVGSSSDNEFELETKFYPGRGGAGKRAALLVVNGALTAAQIERIGFAAMTVDVRDSPSSLDKRPFLGNWLANARADTIGRNLAVMRANDVLHGIRMLAAKPGIDASRISVAAQGVDGFWVLLAAAVDARIGGVWIERMPHNFRSALDQPLNTRLFDALIPGFLLHWDLPDLVALMGKRGLELTEQTDWSGHILGTGN